MGFGAKGTASRERSEENTFKTGLEDTSGSKRAVFDSPQAQQILGYLTGQTSGGPQFTSDAGAAYKGLIDGTGGQNPYVESIIKRSNQEGDASLATNLAKSRASGYRGGTGANIYNQDALIANSANERALGNANLRYNAYDTSAGRDLTSRLAGASGLGQLGQGQQNIAAQLLALLRGEDINAKTKTQQQGVASGTKSSTSGSAGFSFGTGAG